MKGTNLKPAKSFLICLILLSLWVILHAEPQEPEFVPGELIVKLKEGKTLEDIKELNAKYKVNSIGKVFKDTPSPQETLKQLKDRPIKLGTEHDNWYWQLDKNSQEYKDYIAKLEKEKEALNKQIKAQEELIAHLEQRQKRAPEGVTVPDLTNIYLLKTSQDINIIFMVQEYKANANVEYAEPNYIAEEHAIPNDPYFASSNSWGQGYDDLWGLKKIEADKAWDISQGEGVIVAVVDSGIDYNHPDIAANIWKNAGEIPNNGIDDDENGYVDDDKGWDFVYEDNDPIDDIGHGTHVAGTIAAIGNNNIGVIGVSPKAKVMAVKGLGYKEGKDSATVLANCIRYAARNGADVISNSWGANLSNTLGDAIKEAYDAGCVLVFSTGNMNADFSNNSLKSRIEIINVASTDHNDKKSDFSNWGFKVDVAAPGGDNWWGNADSGDNILSLRAQGTGYNDSRSLGADYIRKSGTSMACPHVSGTVALLLSSKPDLNKEEVRQILRVSSDDIEEAGFDVKTGFGRVNAYKALNIKRALQARITSSSDLNIDNSTSMIPITGIADGKYFSSYRLFYARLNTLSDANNLTWSSATGIRHSPVSNGSIAALNINDLSTGLYALRLQAKDIFGMQFEDYLPVSVEKNLLKKIAAEGWYPGFSYYRPAISGNYIVWSSARNANLESSNPDEREKFDIYLDDLTENKERQITSRLGPKYNVNISDNFIVYETFEGRDANYRGGRHYIYLHNLTTGVEENIAEGINPVISGSKLAWIDTNGSIHVYDIPSKKELPIITAKASAVAISGNYVVWHNQSLEKVYSGNEVTILTYYDINCYDLVTGTISTITDNRETLKGRLGISGNRIVWSEERESNWDIYFYDLTTNTKRRLTTDPAEQRNPVISDNYIVWEDKRNGNWDIYLYDLKTNIEQQITANIPPQYSPVISGEKIVWVDERNSQPDIYMTDILTSDTTPPAILHTPVTLKDFPSRYTPISFIATVTDAESGVKETAVYWSRFTRVQVRGRWGLKRWEWRWSLFYKLPMVKAPNNVYKASLSGLVLLNGSVKYYISAKDNAGNSKSIQTYTIR